MPLLDHFRDPRVNIRPWPSFHSRWANALADGLNATLPPRYLAEIETRLGPQVVADVVELEGRAPGGNGPAGGAGGGVAVGAWAPPAATMVLPAVFPDSIEVQVFDTVGGMTLVAVVELVSPANKDRPDSRRAFAAKVAACLQRGVGVVCADVVSSHRFNLHNELIDLLRHDPSLRTADDSAINAVAYRPALRDGEGRIEVWAVPLAVGGPLPVLPLALRDGPLVPLDLDATYTEARRRSRL